MIYFICGHGNGDSGAVGNGYTEAERVRALAERIRAYGGDNVVIGDVSRNYYKENLISKLSFPKGVKIVELHMDSNSSNSARGGHVIIKKGFKADAYDVALANFISGMFPGRSNTIVGRSDLANVNRSAKKGYNYRLVEVCFISNADDVHKFNAEIDEIAKGILKCFEIQASQNPVPSVPSTPNVSTNKLEVDGSWGIATTKATQRILGTTVDGIVSGQPKSNKKYLANAYTGSWKFYSNYKNKGGSAMVRALQRLIGTTADGWFGKASVMALQRFLNNQGYDLVVDGSMGSATVSAWQRYLNSR